MDLDEGRVGELAAELGADFDVDVAATGCGHPMLTPVELKGISQKSCSVLGEMGPKIQWVQSCVVDDKVYCVYIAPDEATVRKHAQRGGFPANRVSEVRATIDPITSESGHGPCREAA